MITLIVNILVIISKAFNSIFPPSVRVALVTLVYIGYSIDMKSGL